MIYPDVIFALKKGAAAAFIASIKKQKAALVGMEPLFILCMRMRGKHDKPCQKKENCAI